MDTSVFKPLGTYTALTSSINSNFGGNKLVRLTYVSAPTAKRTITCKLASDSSIKWTITLTGGQEIIVEKDPTDTITQDDTIAAVFGTAVAYRN